MKILQKLFSQVIVKLLCVPSSGRSWPGPVFRYQVHHFIAGMFEFSVAYWIWCPSSNQEVTGSIPTVGAFFKTPLETPSTGSSPRKQT
ncbi:hypothetical protein DPMN_063606 [Dreissena polymorpha]|uniref:Uncharacterized protein n=1 Tax=Dreissena polymorpha TaxID=45954 RepID=A0A9D4CAU2_DREPO|nr:hypothetical protein DPMN_063606 [Dreissena polymorpha]